MKKTEYLHPYADLLGLEIQSSSDGKSTCLVTFKKTLLNPNNVLHGGVIYSLADTGMGAALSSVLNEGEKCATIEIKIMYIKPAGHFDLICDTEVIKKGRRVALLESEVYSNDELIAKASGSFAFF
jgi:acyl-CoA thioesterase